jgi:hypothetical protein
MVGFLTGFGAGALTGILNEQGRSRDERAEQTKIAMERFERIRTEREKQIEERKAVLARASLYSSMGRGPTPDIAAALEADPGMADMFRSGQARTGDTPAPTAGLVSPPPGGATPVAAQTGFQPPARGGAFDRAVGQVHREESGGRMAPGIVGDGGRAGGPMQVHDAALADVNKRLGTNFTPEQIRANANIGAMVGKEYYAMQLERFGGDHEKAAAAYNAGPTRLARDGLAGMPPATRAYAGRVAAAAGQGGGGNDAAPQQSPGTGASDPIQESGSMTARAPADMSGIPELPDLTPTHGAERPSVIGPTGRGALDMLFGRQAPSRISADARRKYAELNGLSEEQMGAIERPLPRTPFRQGARFQVDAEAPGAVAKSDRDHRERLAEIELQGKLGKETALAGAEARRAAKAGEGPSNSEYTSGQRELEHMVDSDPRSALRLVPNPNSQTGFTLQPRGVPNAATQAYAERVNRARILTGETQRRYPNLSPAEAAAMAWQKSAEPAAPAPGANPPPARQEGGTTTPAPRAPVQVRTRADVEALPSGTPFITPDGKTGTRN